MKESALRLSRLLVEPEVMHRLPEVAAFIALDFVGEVDEAICRIEALPSALLSKDASDLELIAILRAYVPCAYWAELARLKGAPDCLPMLRIMQAAGAKPVLRKAQEVIRAELPLIERELSLIAANTVDLSEHAAPTDAAWLRGSVFGEACKSAHFDAACVRRVIEFFG